MAGSRLRHRKSVRKRHYYVSGFLFIVADIVFVQDIVSEKHTLPTSSTLRALRQDPVRFGLRAVPSLPLEDVEGPAKVYDVDIVAVHGLGGDFYKTWAMKPEYPDQQGVFWLAHLLPVDLPGARIFTFGYSSEPILSRTVASVRDYAKQLLQSLLDQQQDVSLQKIAWPTTELTLQNQYRPTVFICHSLGGIVVKQVCVQLSVRQ